MKISDKIKLATESGRPFFSFEYFPPKTEQGVVNLYDRIERMSKLDPLFVAVTWGAGGATAQRTLELCSACQGVFGIETLMHLTCTNMDKQMLDRALDSAKSLGIQNILALRGDIPRGEEYWTSCDGNFKYAIDLVKRLSFLTKVFIPELLKEKLELVKANDQAVKDLGVEYAVEMIQQLQAEGVKGVHLTTLNLENTIQRVIDALGMGRNAAAAAAAAVAAGSGLTRLGASTIVRAAKSSVVSQASEQLGTPLQQQQQQQQKREDGELVAESSSTQRVWDDFPNGRWGDARSPAFGNLNTYGAMLKFDPHEANQVWGRPQTLGDISSLFVKYVEGSIPSLPWSDEPLLAESGKIQDELVRLNKLGYWTLASQPALDGVNSSDSTYGWGPKGGYIYQKAFVECFVPGDMFPKFL
ncbi:methylenetetrahydrofolate reductase 1, partial [Dipsacomyces acuminosporus]